MKNYCIDCKKVISKKAHRCVYCSGLSKRGENNYFYGKKHTEKTKKEIGNANKGHTAWSKGLTKETNESLKELSKKMKAIENSKEWKETVGKRKGEKISRTKNSKEWKETVGKIANTKRSKKRKKLIKEGKIEIWNKGLNKETDERVRKNSINTSKSRKKLFKDKKLISPMEFLKKENPIKYKDTCEKLSEKMSGNKNPMKNNDIKEKQRKTLNKTYKDNPDILKKMSETLKKKYSSGEIVVHNKGKNAENYEPIKRASIKSSASLQGINLNDWKGFVSKEPYDDKWTDRFKKEIRERDNHVCMLCGTHREKLNRAFDVHHIDGNKKLTIPQNCISLCLKCHRIVESRIKDKINYWKPLFQSLLKEKYGYKYSENNEIILEINHEK